MEIHDEPENEGPTEPENDARVDVPDGKEDPLQIELENAEIMAQNDNSADSSPSLVQLFQTILDNERMDEVALKIKEKAIFGLCRVHCARKSFEEILCLVRGNSSFFNAIPKARTAKIVRELVDVVAKVEGTLEIQISLCQSIIEWCRAERRTFLRQRIEARLSSLFLHKGNAQEALAIVTRLLKELKRLDDKQLLLEVHWIESQAHQALLNLSKARAALTAARATANSVYVSPVMLGELDLMSGILHCEERDYTTSYSYLYEAFEAFYAAKLTSSSVRSLSYMILVKVLGKHADDVAAIISTKSASDLKGNALVAAMIEIADASKRRSLHEFDLALARHETVLSTDSLIGHNVQRLHNDMLESNIIKIIKPYSRIESSHILHQLTGHEMSLIELDRKLGQMILDNKIHGTVDQANGYLVIYEDADDSNLESARFEAGLSLMANLNTSITSLQSRFK